MRRYFRTMALLLLCVGALGLAVGCSDLPTTVIAPLPPTAHPSPASRPILYLTLEGSAPPRHPQMNAVSQDGSRVTFPIGGGATWSPDGQWIAYVGGGTELRLTNTSGETKTVFTTHGTNEGLLERPMWSPDGRSIAVIVLTHAPRGPYANSLAIIDVTQQKVRGRYGFSNDVIHLPYHFTPADKFRWSPDGHKVLISWERAAVVSVDTGHVETISSRAVIAEWAPSSDAVYYFEVKGTGVTRPPYPPRELGAFYVKRLGSPGATIVMDEEAVAASGFRLTSPMHGVMTLSPSGSRLAISLGSKRAMTAADDVIRIYDLRGGGPPTLTTPAKTIQTEEKIVALEWGPDEHALAVVSTVRSGAGVDIKIKVLNLPSDKWRVLAGWRLMASMEIEVFTLKVLSWTQ